MKDSLQLSLLIQRRTKDIWKFITKNYHLQQWWGDNVNIDLKFSGVLHEFWLDDNGDLVSSCAHLVEMKKNFYLKFFWYEEGSEIPSQLELWLVAKGDNTILKLKHSGLLDFQYHNCQDFRNELSKIWQRHLSALKNYSEKRSYLAA